MMELQLYIRQVGVLCIALMLIGCGDGTDSPELDNKGGTGPAENISTGDGGAGGAANEERVDAAAAVVVPKDAKLVDEWWEARFFKGTRIGISHTKILNWGEGDNQRNAWETVTKINAKRFGEVISVEVNTVSILDASGKLVACSSEMQSAGQKNTQIAVRDGNQLIISMKSGGSSSERAMEWPVDNGDFYVAERDMRKSLPKPGEKRSYVALSPMTLTKVLIDTVATEPETVTLLDGEQVELLHVDHTLVVGDQQMNMTVWLDDEGRAVKTFDASQQMELVGYRVSKEEAESKIDVASLVDLGKQTIVRLSEEMPDLKSLKSAEYEVKVVSGDIATHFVAGPGQSVEKIGEQTAKISVNPSNKNTSDLPPPGKEDSASNSLIQKNDPAVVKLAQSVLPDLQITDATPSDQRQQLALELEKMVRSKMVQRNFTQALGSAAEVAKSLSGDCTEHAVLLAAVCRARDLPARVAVGLVYFPRERGFAYHMWDEVWIGDRWIALDATLGQGGISPAHLKIASSSLAGADVYAVMLPVANLLGQLEIQLTGSKSTEVNDVPKN